MSTLDSDFAFGSLFRRSRDSRYSAGHDRDDFADDEPAEETRASGGMAALSIFAGLGIISAVIFTTGYLALLSETPAIWIHRLMALTVAQSIVISAVAMKLLPLVERRQFSLRIIADRGADRLTLPEPSAASDEEEDTSPPPPPKPVIGGKLAGREYLEHPDGTIEIDTLVGRRRFASIAAAREFVGA